MATGTLEVLAREECFALLGRTQIGRVGISLAGITDIFPVHFCLIDDTIVFRTGLGTKLHIATRGTTVSFEVDHFDPDARRGWSVLVVGSSSLIRQPPEIHEARKRLQPDCWIPGDFDKIVRIVPHVVSGRWIAERHPTPHRIQPLSPV